MVYDLEETYGKLALFNIMAHIWTGDWDNYEAIFEEIPASIVNEFPFHEHYKKDEVALWYDNYFVIPGDYFVSPYLSSYSTSDAEEYEKTKQDLLCLIGLYEKLGFYYPLDQELFPDHFGSLTGFLVSLIRVEIDAIQHQDEILYHQIKKLQRDVLTKYLHPQMAKLKKEASEKISHPFFTTFIDFFADSVGKEWVAIQEMERENPHLPRV